MGRVNQGIAQRRNSMLVAASGTIIEWFDFSLFFYTATALSTTFYPNSEDSLLIVLATGAVGFVFRPLGAVVFGHIGDTRGRTTALIWSAGLIALAMAGIAAMPGYGSIGLWGGVGVLLLRALAGFSVGAEYTGIMVYLMESAKPHRRGFAASWAAANSEIGALLAVGSASALTIIMGNEDFVRWGWRLLFVLGAILAASMIPLRRYMVETAPPRTSQAASASATTPRGRGPLLHALSTQRRPMLVSFLISTVGSATYFLTITYLPTFMETTHGGTPDAALSLGTVAAIAAIVVTPFAGLLSDAIGRRRAFMLTFAAVVAFALPGYMLLGNDSTGLIFTAAAALALPAAAWSAIAAAAVPEQFPQQHGRYSGMAVGYNLATVFFGGLTPLLVNWMTTTTGDPLTPAYYAIVITVAAGIPAIALMSDDARRRKLGKAPVVQREFDALEASSAR